MLKWLQLVPLPLQLPLLLPLLATAAAAADKCLPKELLLGKLQEKRTAPAPNLFPLAGANGLGHAPETRVVPGYATAPVAGLKNGEGQTPMSKRIEKQNGSLCPKYVQRRLPPKCGAADR